MFKIKLKLNAVAMSYLSSGEKVRAIVENQQTKRSTNLNFITLSGIKVAAVSFPFKSYRNISDYVSQINQIVCQCVESGAQLITFPELCGMFPLTVTPAFTSIYNDVTHLENNEDNYRQAFLAVCESSLGFCGEVYLNTFSKLAQAYGVMIAAGSIFCWENGRVKNRSFLFDENGRVIGHQDKLFLSPLERKLEVEPGSKVNAIKTKLGSIGLFTAYDLKNFEPFVIGSSLGLDICVVAGSMFNTDTSLARYRAAESNTCFIVPVYCGGESFNRNLTNQAAIYAPLSATRSKDGIVKKEVIGAHAIARVDISKIKSSFDIYTADQNADFYKENFK